MWDVFRIFHCWAFVNNLPVIRVDTDQKILDLYKRTVENASSDDDDEDSVPVSSNHSGMAVLLEILTPKQK